MELDFGNGGMEITSVRVGQNRAITMSRLNGIKLSIMDNTRTVLFEYTFDGITQTSPTMYIFNVNADGTVHCTTAS